MHDYVKFYIEKIENHARVKKEPLELLLIGGLAMSFYEMPRYTIDIDAEIKCSEKFFSELIEFLKKENINFNISENISGWGIIPLPAGYRERAITVYKSDFLILKILEPIDFVFSKLLRGTEEDFSDATQVIKRYRITKDSLIGREALIKYPKDTETLFFKKKFQHLMELID
ncbi:MAG: hypothetical protein HY752_05050 [Nitrospirae bacterium]|nr:hypothetical protein [Nitrospirota bacterium]